MSDMSATHRQIADHAFAQRQATDRQLRDAARWLAANGRQDDAARLLAILAAR